MICEVADQDRMIQLQDYTIKSLEKSGKIISDKLHSEFSARRDLKKAHQAELAAILLNVQRLEREKLALIKDVKETTKKLECVSAYQRQSDKAMEELQTEVNQMKGKCKQQDLAALASTKTIEQQCNEIKKLEAEIKQLSNSESNLHLTKQIENLKQRLSKHEDVTATILT